MKKTILSISLLCIGLVSFADVVPSSKALSVAKEFMNASSLTLVWDGTETATKSSEDPAFYVYNVSGGGWVIVSAEDSATPIIGYNDKGSFNLSSMPDNLKNWLGLVKNDIKDARSRKAAPTAEVKALWASPRGHQTKADSKVVLETASWDQESPYNGYLSNYVTSNNRGVSGLYTGCVATAMSEVLRYHQWPEKGTGTIGGYKTSSKSYTVASVDISSHEYDWANMPLEYGKNYTTAQGNAVAQLMADCGMMVEMDYTTSGSGAYDTAIVPALVEHMQYSKIAHLEYRSDYSTAEWMDMIMYDIDHYGPILYAGVDSSNGGHEFVCSGYDPDNAMIYINWGWSGENNGYFTFTLKITGSYTFSESQSAVFGIYPDKDGSSEYPEGQTGERIELASYSSGSTSYYGLTLGSGTVAKGETFTLDGGVFYNMSNGTYSGDLKAALIDKDGNLKEFISESTFEDSDKVEQFYGFNLEEVECTITKDIEFGDRVAFMFLKSDGTWEAVKYPATDYNGIWTWACVDVTLIKVKDSYSSGDKFSFELLPRNKRISSTSWSFDGSSTTADFVTLTSGTHTVSVTVTYNDKTTETIYQTIKVN